MPYVREMNGVGIIMGVYDMLLKEEEKIELSLYCTSSVQYVVESISHV